VTDQGLAFALLASDKEVPVLKPPFWRPMGKPAENSHTGIVDLEEPGLCPRSGLKGLCEIKMNDDSREASPVQSTVCQDRTVLAGQEGKIYFDTIIRHLQVRKQTWNCLCGMSAPI